MTYPIWPYEPQPQITEALEWYTDVMSPKSGEQRMRGSPYPRRELSYVYELDEDVLVIARQNARLIGVDEVLVPFWPDVSRVGALTAHTVTLPVSAVHKGYVEGGYAMVWDSDLEAEACLISHIGSGTITLDPWVVNSYSNAFVCPMLLSTFSDAFRVDRRAASRHPGSARFLCTNDALVDPVTGIAYLGNDVNVVPVAILGSTGESMRRDSQTLDSALGPIYRWEMDDGARRSAVVAWKKTTRAQVWDLRTWLYGRSGRLTPFWQPTWNPDITITHDIAEDDTTVEIEDIGYSTWFANPSDFAIILKSGAMAFFRATTAAAWGAGKQVLTVPSAFTSAIAVADIDRTSVMHLSRLDSDRVELQHDTGGAASCSVPIVEVTA